LGYLPIPAASQRLRAGDHARADGSFARAVEMAERFGDADLLAMGRLGQGTSLIAQGEVEAGAALHDEIMVAVTSGEVSPVVAGMVFCAVVENCREILDLGRR